MKIISTDEFEKCNDCGSKFSVKVLCFTTVLVALCEDCRETLVRTLVNVDADSIENKAREV